MLCRSLEALDPSELVRLFPEPGLEILEELERLLPDDCRTRKILPIVQVYLLFLAEHSKEDSHSLLPTTLEVRVCTVTIPPIHPHLNLDEVLQGGSRRRIHWHPPI
jgi:hypothetical protein